MKSEIRSTCCYCGTGCGVLIATEGGRITGVRGDPDHPANFGRLCTKGASLHLTAGHAGRLLHPELRRERAALRTRVAWDAALDEAAARFAAIIREHGPDAVAFYVSGQLLTEDYYAFNKLAKGLIGTNNIDTNSRLCMSSAVVGYKQTLGADAPPCSYTDIDSAEVMLIAGANPAVAHPILFRRIEEARAARPDLKIIVVDPRRSETAAIADLHLPIAPGSDIALFNGMLHVLCAEGMIDRAYIDAHTEGFAALEARLPGYAPDIVATVCGVPAADIVTAARWFGRSPAALSLYCQGLNQSTHGTHNNAAIIHLHLATGQIGRPGAGPFSLTGQPNAMGGREVGGLATLMSGHREIGNPQHRAELAAFWGVPEVPAKPGKTAVDLFRALESGAVKAVWIACTNPAQSLPDQAAVRRGLIAAEFVVLQEAYADTDTAPYADLMLPAASWGEKEGCVTNSERRISRVQAAVTPPGEARPDWAIITDFAARLATALGEPDRARLLAWGGTEAIFEEHRETTRGRDLDIGGLSYAVLEQNGPQQWPYPEGASSGQARLYTDGRFPTPTGRARFVVVDHRPVAEPVDAAWPLALLSGRLRDQWHGMSRTGKVGRLFNENPEPLLTLAPADLAAHGLAAGDLVRLSGRRGAIVIRVAADAALPAGRSWLPMHWGGRFMHGAGANALTAGLLDPFSGQPELKHAAVRIERADLPWPLAVMRRCADAATAQSLLDSARSLLPHFPYATLGLYGSSAPVVVLRAADSAPYDAALLAEVDRIFGFADETAAIIFHDRRQQVSKRALLEGERVIGVRLAGETVAFHWLRAALAADDAAEPFPARYAVAPLEAPPSGLPPPRRIVCKCADVDEETLSRMFAEGANLAAVQDRLKCGTFCGSCLPDIKRMAAATTTTN